MSEENKEEEPAWKIKQREYEVKKARAKALKLRTTCTICGAAAKLNCPCGTTQYCTVACQRVDWRERGHRKACKKIRDERAAEAARAEAPTPPPKEVFYGPAPRSHADEVRARIAAEHEAARARREANPEPEPASARFGSRCPVCFEEWDVNTPGVFRTCCCRMVCKSCEDKIGFEACALCRLPLGTNAENLARLRRQVEKDVPEAIEHLAECYRDGKMGLVKSAKKAAKIYKRAVELGSVDAMVSLASLFQTGSGVKLNIKKAEQLFRMAADLGDAVAQAKLAHLIYVNDEDDPESFRYVKSAADQGLTGAEAILGLYYVRGYGGVGVDLEEARRWTARAAAKGNEQAKEELALMDAGHLL
jgi:hypothetical protein